MLEIEWRPVASDLLTAVRAALDLPSKERCRQLDDITHALGLKHLTGFVERMRAQKKP